MKKHIRNIVTLGLVVAMTLSSVACGQKQEVVEEPEIIVEEPVEVVNPMSEVTEDYIYEELGIKMSAPKFSEDPHWYIYETETELIAELQFGYEGHKLSYRAMPTEKAENISVDISGQSEINVRESDGAVQNIPAKFYIGDFSGHVCWNDEDSKIVYSLGSADKVDSKFLQKVANMIFVSMSSYNYVAALDVFKTSNYDFAEDKGKTIAWATYDSLALNSDDWDMYSNLGEALDDFDSLQKESALESLEENAEWAKDPAYGQIGVAFYYDSRLYVTRADEKVFSVVENLSTYEGGAHGMYYFFCNNFDTQTGDPIRYDEFFSNMDKVEDILEEGIREKYPDMDYEFENLRESLDTYFETPGWLQWSVGYNGVTFYFSPYQLASYAAGSFTYTIYYDEHPELFDSAYLVRPKYYTIPIINDQMTEYEIDETMLLEACSGYRDCERYIICTPNQDYLYISYVDGIGLGNLAIYLINDGELEFYDIVVGVSAQRDSFATLLTDPTRMLLSTRINVVKPTLGIAYYAIDETGVPVCENPVFTIYDDSTITTKEDITAISLGDETNEEEVVIEAETELMLVASDNLTYIDVMNFDGDEFRIYIEDANVWPQMLSKDSISVEDAFYGAGRYEKYVALGMWKIGTYAVNAEKNFSFETGTDGTVTFLEGGTVNIEVNIKEIPCMIEVKSAEVELEDEPISDGHPTSWRWHVIKPDNAADDYDEIYFTVLPNGNLELVTNLNVDGNESYFGGEFYKESVE